VVGPADAVEPLVSVVLPFDAVVDGALGVADASAEATLATPAASAPPSATPTALPTSHFFVFTDVIRFFSIVSQGLDAPGGSDKGGGGHCPAPVVDVGTSRAYLSMKGCGSRSLFSVTQPGDPNDDSYQPLWWEQTPPAPAQEYPEPNGNYLGMQQPPAAGGYPQQVATGHLRVNLQGSSLTSSMITPTLLINNQVVQASYGPNDYFLPAGPYRVSAHTQWMRQYGQAALDVAVYPGQTIEVFYASPLNQFTTGSIGFTKQKRKGLALFVGLIAVVMVFVVGMLFVGLGS
jgi:hypothetical protein